MYIIGLVQTSRAGGLRHKSVFGGDLREKKVVVGGNGSVVLRDEVNVIFDQRSITCSPIVFPSKTGLSIMIVP